jgi:hypothetical protein
VYGLFGMGPILLSMCDGERKLFTIYVVASVGGVAAAYPLILMFSATGAAMAMIVSNGLIAFLSWNVGRTDLGVDCTFVSLLRPSSWRSSAPGAPLHRGLGGD